MKKGAGASAPALFPPRQCATYGVPFFTAVRCVDELDPELLLDPLELDDPEDEAFDDPDDPEELDELLDRGCELPLLLEPAPCL